MRNCYEKCKEICKAKENLKNPDFYGCFVHCIEICRENMGPFQDDNPF